MLELASNLVAKEQLPAAPVLFFFSGGEEPLCQVIGLAEPCTYTKHGEACMQQQYWMPESK